MGSPRAVRIPRRRPAGGAPANAVPAASRENRGGRERARRWFSVFALGLVALYVAFVALSATAAGGLTGAPDALGLFTVLAIGFAGWAWSITLHRAPLRIRWSGGSLSVDETPRRTRRFERGPAFEQVVVERYPKSPLGPLPTELVRVGEAGGRQRVYLVEVGLFDAPPTA
jgi:hypothetical protein